MIHLIYGNQSPTIKSQVKKIVNSFLGEEQDDFNYVKLDGYNTLVQEAADECRYVSLGYDKKVVLLENCYFLLKPKPRNKIESEQDYKDLLKYLKEENGSDCTLILTVPSTSIDEKCDIFVAVKEKGNIIQIVDPDEKTFSQYIKDYCVKHNINIDTNALNELAARTDGDVSLFKNSIEKLSLYTDHIKYADVCKMVARPLEDNAFLVSNYLLDGRNNDAVMLFRDLRTSNIEPVVLIAQIANQFRMLNQIRFLSKVKRYLPDQIAKELKIKPGRVYVSLKSINSISEDTILNTLEDLYKLDKQIKSGLVDRFYAFELFLIKFQRK